MTRGEKLTVSDPKGAPRNVEYLDREMEHQGNKQEVTFIGAGTGSVDSH